MSATKRNNGTGVRYDPQRAPVLHQTMSERRLAQALRGSERPVWVPMATRRSDVQQQQPAVMLPPLAHELLARICARAAVGAAMVLFLGVLRLAGWL